MMKYPCVKWDVLLSIRPHWKQMVSKSHSYCRCIFILFDFCHYQNQTKALLPIYISTRFLSHYPFAIPREDPVLQSIHFLQNTTQLRIAQYNISHLLLVSGHMEQLAVYMHCSLGPWQQFMNMAITEAMKIKYLVKISYLVLSFETATLWSESTSTLSLCGHSKNCSYNTSGHRRKLVLERVTWLFQVNFKYLRQLNYLHKKKPLGQEMLHLHPSTPHLWFKWGLWSFNFPPMVICRKPMAGRTVANKIKGTCVWILLVLQFVIIKLFFYLPPIPLGFHECAHN